LALPDLRWLALRFGGICPQERLDHD